ncbi:hypothetical protein GYMLUDRAFT_243231 [Collybiopsis luxurians FD-317 M1]|uniref:Uncharacterized protein n=1 Tax=Collybiopsis luxurians FD-317 M1 TaxID=944289 RepID=A0A0D0CG25_9AGAR|nr:hypothetical protein GYMLUDRAFT_243231 [Collybiopsis luxurians FD-317 M1]
MRSLCEGFWPFYAKWKEECNQRMDNYVTELEDIAVLRAHRDQEIAANHWSEPLPADFTLLPDQTHSGLNDGIPHAEGKVKYDDMHTLLKIRQLKQQ